MHQVCRSDDSKDSFYDELQQVSNHFPKYHMKILLRDFNVKLEREDIFKLTIGNDSLHQDTNNTAHYLVVIKLKKDWQ